MGKDKKPSLCNVVRKARRVGMANKIEGIRAIREAYPDAGLLGAKAFFDTITGAWEHVPAVHMTALWCEEHWNDRLHCGCDIGDATPVPKMQAAVDSTPAVSPVVAASQPTQCKQGKCVPGCADPWHRAARWIGQPGNYTNLMRWVDAGMPDDESIPFAKREGDWLGVEAK